MNLTERIYEYSRQLGPSIDIFEIRDIQRTWTLDSTKEAMIVVAPVVVNKELCSLVQDVLVAPGDHESGKERLVGNCWNGWLSKMTAVLVDKC